MFIAEPATMPGGFGAIIHVESFGDPLSGGTFIANGSAVGDPSFGTAAGTILMASDAGDWHLRDQWGDYGRGRRRRDEVQGLAAGAAFITVNGGQNGGPGGSLTLR